MAIWRGIYYFNDNGVNVAEMLFSVWQIWNFLNQIWFIKVCGYAETTDVGGVLKVYFPFIPVAADYEVLETDYESYACVYSCAADVLVAHTEIGYILTREQEYNQELVSTIKCWKVIPITPKH